MTVVKKRMYPRIKFVGPFEPRYANLLEPVDEALIKPRSVYIKRVDGWFCVFRKTKEGKARQGNYRSLIDAAFAVNKG